jgi:hypothetical protein
MCEYDHQKDKGDSRLKENYDEKEILSCKRKQKKRI